MWRGGIDEAGRGCIAGSLFLCGVIAKEGGADSIANRLGAKDSKLLSPKKREQIAQELAQMQENGEIFYVIIEKSAKEIDKHGLSSALRISLESLIEHLSQHTQENIHFIFDGNTTFNVRIPAPLQSRITLHTQIKGDRDNGLISCASILAKVQKDRQMREIDSLYPQYQFAKNKGYGTPAHIEAIKKYGLSPFHRQSFRICTQNAQNTLF